MEKHEIIKQVFEYENFIKHNGWFFDAKWKDIELNSFESENNWLNWINGIWIDGAWINGIWYDGEWLNGIWEYGTWQNGIWGDGVWNDGTWRDGIWRDGTWKSGKIYNPKTGKYEPSTVNPNECKWSLSYGKA